MKLSNKDYLIRKLELEDISEVIKLGSSEPSFTTESGSFWTKDQLGKWSLSKQDLLLVAEHDKKIVGFSLYAVHVPTHKVTWENLYVHPSFRNSGIASALVSEGLKSLEELNHKYIMLFVNADDQDKFLKFTEKFGFIKGPKVLWVDKFIS
jgi:ribosomal protein S18 acetylase RimI-like enzyme